MLFDLVIEDGGVRGLTFIEVLVESSHTVERVVEQPDGGTASDRA